MRKRLRCAKENVFWPWSSAKWSIASVKSVQTIRYFAVSEFPSKTMCSDHSPFVVDLYLKQAVSVFIDSSKPYPTGVYVLRPRNVTPKPPNRIGCLTEIATRAKTILSMVISRMKHPIASRAKNSGIFKGLARASRGGSILYSHSWDEILYCKLDTKWADIYIQENGRFLNNIYAFRS